MGSAVCLVGDVGGLASIGMPECVCSGGSVAALGVVVLVVRDGACGRLTRPCRLGWKILGFHMQLLARILGEDVAGHLGCHILHLAGRGVLQGSGTRCRLA